MQGHKSISKLPKEHEDTEKGGKARRDEESSLVSRDELEYAGDEGRLEAMSEGQTAAPRSNCRKRGSSQCRAVVPGQTGPRQSDNR